MPRDPKLEVKQHITDKVSACVRCTVKLAKDVRKEADISPTLARLELQEARINSTQKMLFTLPNIAMDLEDQLNAMVNTSADLAGYLMHVAGPPQPSAASAAEAPAVAEGPAATSAVASSVEVQAEGESAEGQSRAREKESSASGSAGDSADRQGFETANGGSNAGKEGNGHTSNSRGYDAIEKQQEQPQLHEKG